jgi:DNA-binding response OmpR family regulator
MAKILVVEDDPDLSERLKDWLTFQKHDVELVYTGPEALENLQFGEFDIAVLDWTLPGMDGPDVCKEYRKAGGTKPILMLTGHDSAEAKATGLAAGANDFLIKPFHLKELSARLETLLQKQSAEA